MSLVSWLWQSPAYPDEVARLVDHLNEQIEKHGLEWSEVILFLRENSSEDVMQDDDVCQAAERVRDGEVPSDIKAFKKLAIEICDTLDVDIDLYIFKSKIERFRRLVANFFIILIFLFLSFLVLGGILGGHSELISRPSLTLLLFLLLLALLGVYEGLQISISMLELRDLSVVKDEYPRAYDLKQKVDLNGLKPFLSGRQLLVIVIVFFAAQITTFPNMDSVPLIGVTLPGFINLVLLDLGVAGALFVLWTSQLGSQLLAESYPEGFLNMPLMDVAYDIAVQLEPLTRPSQWLSAWGPVGKDIPISPTERYRQDVNKIHGYGCTGLKNIWNVGYDESVLKYEGLTTIKQSGIQEIRDDRLIINPDLVPDNMVHSCGFIIMDEDEEARWVEIEPTDEPTSSSNQNRFVSIVSPNHGPFIPGEVVSTSFELTFSGRVNFEEDYISIDEPTKYVYFRIEFDSNVRFDYVRVKIYKTSQPSEETSEDLSIQYDDSENPYALFIDFYPSVGTHYEFSWS